MTTEQLHALFEQLETLNSFWKRQCSDLITLDFPQDFEVTSDDGYSLGKFAFDSNKDLWIFMAYETGE